MLITHMRALRGRIRSGRRGWYKRTMESRPSSPLGWPVLVRELGLLLQERTERHIPHRMDILRRLRRSRRIITRRRRFRTHLSIPSRRLRIIRIRILGLQPRVIRTRMLRARLMRLVKRRMGMDLMIVGSPVGSEVLRLGRHLAKDGWVPLQAQLVQVRPRRRSGIR